VFVFEIRESKCKVRLPLGSCVVYVCDSHDDILLIIEREEQGLLLR